MKPTKTLSLLTATLLLAACSVAPVYEKPQVETPAQFKEASTHATGEQSSQWKTAEPTELNHRGQWWQVFNDLTLDNLEDEALAANQNLQAATARLAQSRALFKDERSNRYPQLSGGISPGHQRVSPDAQRTENGSEQTLWRAQAQFAYEADLFGRVSSLVNAAQADAEQSAALLRSILLSLQADVAQQYFTIRELDAERDIYQHTVKLREQTVQLTQHRYDAGDISELELARAKTELAAARSEELGVTRRRAIAEHALAILLGKSPAEFSLAVIPLQRISINVPAGLPSSLLERRPDIAAAERAMAAANARIGVAKAAYFPRLNITGALGYESSELGSLFEWSNRTFLLGPLIGTMLSMPIFDGGRREAGLERARAVYEEDVAKYRQTVLNAFGEVEDNLASLRILDNQSEVQDTAVASSQRASHLAQSRYREGLVSYLEVIDADRTLLQQKRVTLQLDGERARATVNLIRALGGSWQQVEQGTPLAWHQP
ncbi:efflux transporter outer membrane subunit [Methylobacillus methanolivorans]|uniref:Efflux transporter outer membrane subunit n=1 Tax=Methylobacillus methanolivorans TaxID=1848927 RepID=A0ABW8GJJ8_9PROT